MLIRSAAILPRSLPYPFRYQSPPPSNPLHSTPVFRSEALTNLFDTGDRPSLFVTKLNNEGFHLSDNLVVPGGLILLGGRPLLWDVDPPKDDPKAGLEGMWTGWGKERFSVFELVIPRPGQLGSLNSYPSALSAV